MERAIVFDKLDSPHQVLLLKDHLREIYRLLDPVLVVKGFSATPTFDCDEGNAFRITMTNNITGVTIKNPYIGRRITIIFLQDNSGNHTVAWTTTVKLTGASFTTTATANAASAITLQYDGTSWYEVSRALDLR